MITIPLWALMLLCAAHLPHAALLTAADVREHRLPNRLVLQQAVLVTAAAGCAAAFSTRAADQLLNAMILAAAITVGAVLLSLLLPAALGMGDAKALFATVLMTALLGAQTTLGALLFLVVAAGAASVLVLVRTRGRLGTAFAFGPIILALPYGGLLLGPAAISLAGL